MAPVLCHARHSVYNDRLGLAPRPPPLRHSERAWERRISWREAASLGLRKRRFEEQPAWSRSGALFSVRALLAFKRSFAGAQDDVGLKFGDGLSFLRRLEWHSRLGLAPRLPPLRHSERAWERRISWRKAESLGLRQPRFEEQPALSRSGAFAFRTGVARF